MTLPDCISLRCFQFGIYSGLAVAAVSLVLDADTQAQALGIWLLVHAIVSFVEVLRVGAWGLGGPTAALPMVGYCHPSIAPELAGTWLLLFFVFALRLTLAWSWKALRRALANRKNAKRARQATVRVVIPRLPREATASAEEILRAYGLTGEQHGT